jgi:hypothetical protein
MSKGDVLAILMPNCPEYLLALLGTTGRDISNLCPDVRAWTRTMTGIGFKRHFKGVGWSTELKHFIKL